MPASTSTSNKLLGYSLVFACLCALAYARPAKAAEGAPSAGKASQPEDEDFTGSPFTEYGEFNEDADEAADAKFFQYGRLFGISLGGGYQGAGGNRGLLWQGGFPNIDFKLHYWFDFNFALDLNFFT